jgi:hypothetical protein
LPQMQSEKTASGRFMYLNATVRLRITGAEFNVSESAKDELHKGLKKQH